MNVQLKCCLTCFPSLEGLALSGLFILSQDLRFLKSTSTSKYWSVSNNLSSAVDRAVETFVTVLVPCQIQLQVGFSFSQSLPVGLGSICIFLLVDLTLLVCFLSMLKFSQKLLFQACSPPITSLTRILHVGLDYSWAWRRLSMSLLSSIFFSLLSFSRARMQDVWGWSSKLSVCISANFFSLQCLTFITDKMDDGFHLELHVRF